MEFDLTFTQSEIAVIIGSILVAEPTMPESVALVALSIVDKLDAAFDKAGV